MPMTNNQEMKSWVGFNSRLLKNKNGEEQCVEKAGANDGAQVDAYILQSEPRSEIRQAERLSELDLALTTNKTFKTGNKSCHCATEVATSDIPLGGFSVD